MRITAAGLALALLLSTRTAHAGDLSPGAPIRQLLDEQVAAWNRGDLKAYMSGYWNSPELTFFSNATATRGWQPTLERYRRRYQSAGAEMGRLDFPELKIDALGEAALVRGEWHLTLSKGKELRGRFTLYLRKLPEGWRIVHDHSSG